MESVGIFELKCAHDLFQKLKHDFRQLEQNQSNPYVAFNFFVTAEHMLDWLYPGRRNETKLKQCRDNELILQICSHVANGAKHFKVEAPRHKSVIASKSTGSYMPKGFDHFPKNYFPEKNLILELKGKAESQYGPSISALSLARAVMEYWEHHPEIENLRTPNQAL